MNPFLKISLRKQMPEGEFSTGGSGEGGGQGGSGGAAGGSGSTGGTGAAGTGGAPADWRSSLPDDIKGEASLGAIKTVADLAKSYIHAQKAIGKDKIALPDKHATRDDYQAILRKLGVPEKVDEYKVNVKEGKVVGDAFLNEFRAAAHKAGMLPWQAEELLDFYESKTSGAMSAADQEYKQKVDTDIANLKKEWGTAFDQKIARANVALKEFLPDEADRKALMEDGFATNTRLIKLMENASKLMKEDKFVGQGAGNLSGALSPSEALSKAREIIGNKDHPYRNPSHPNHKAAKDEVAAYYKMANPE